MSTFLDKYKAFCAKDDNLTTFTSTSITGKGHGLLFSIFAGSTRSLKNISNEGITHVKAGCTDKTVRQGQFKAFCQVMLLGGYFSYDKDSDNYAITPKGLCMESFSSFKPTLSYDDIFCLTLITLLDGKFRNPDGNEENTCFIRNVVRLIGICYNLSYSITDLLVLCEEILSDKETQEPWKYTIFWLLSFYKSPEFLKEIIDCGFDDINEVVTYINKNKANKTFTDIVSKKFCSSGLYQRSTFMEDVEMVYVLTHVIKRIHTMNNPYELWNHIIRVISYSRTVNKDIIIKFIGQNEDVFNNIFSALKADPILSSFSAMFSIVKSNKQTNIMNTTYNYYKYQTAIRTKPFLLLAGISGTGKSRIVRELAFKSCPKYLQDKDGTTPGNYCMIEVKPNWHDSTELLGYFSNLSKGYQFKKFVKFLIKAKMFPAVPFFVCLDEMNLAPVEQYFAEILSVLETRKVVVDEDGTKRIKTGAIIEAEHFKALGKISNFNQNFTDRDIYMKLHDIATEDKIADEVKGRMDLTTEGLTLPDNVIIVGTVNMDDTTHQFSRKVIDRAMTIEMNGGKLKNMFGASHNLNYLDEEEQQKWQVSFKQNYVTADDVLAAHPDKSSDIVKLLPEKLEAINEALSGTPFEVSYRVLNELTIMVGVMLDDSPEENIENIVNNALDRILLMKILPRIEGDSDMFNLKVSEPVGNVICRDRLEWLRELAPVITTDEDEEKDHQQTAKEKIIEMKERLDNQEFTRFWP